MTMGNHLTAVLFPQPSNPFNLVASSSAWLGMYPASLPLKAAVPEGSLVFFKVRFYELSQTQILEVGSSLGLEYGNSPLRVRPLWLTRV